MNPRRAILWVWAALLALAAGGSAAAVSLDMEAGWDGQTRVDAWTPIFVTLRSDQPLNVLLELYAPQSGAAAMSVRQVVAAGQTAQTYILYSPFIFNLNQAGITVRDAQSGKLLAGDKFEGEDASGGLQRKLTLRLAEQSFFALCGPGNSLGILRGHLEFMKLTAAAIRPDRLPPDAVGYDALHVLVLADPSWEQLTIEQQRAIAQWVRGGGSLLVIAGSQTPAADSPLGEILPCRLGPPTRYELSQATLARYGLGARFAHLNGRKLVAAESAISMPLFGDGEPTLVSGRAGFGQVRVLAADVSMLLFDDEKRADAFWRPILTGLCDLATLRQDNTSAAVYDPALNAQRRELVSLIANDLGDVPGVGTFHFSYIAWTLVGLMLVVGPVDWLILKRTGRQPWTWVTTSGWIALVTVGAIYLGHVLRSGDVHVRTLTVLDQADGQVVGRVSATCIYSPQTTDYDLRSQREGWWRPLSVMEDYWSNSRLSSQMDCRQDEHGNQPLPLRVNVWNLRFLTDADNRPQEPWLGATLRIAPGQRISGVVKNVSPWPIVVDQILTSAGDAEMQLTLAPGAQQTISAKLTGGVRYPLGQLRGYGPYAPKSTALTYAQQAALAWDRTGKIERLLKDQPLALVVAHCTQPPAPVTLGGQTPLQRHTLVLRALVPASQ